MRNEAGWNISGPLLWGYFFTDHIPAKLQAAVGQLESLGYRTVALYEAEADSPDEGTDEPLYFLHVERVELHTPASLHTRNGDFNELALKLDLASYDGWDVGPVPVKSP